ncbi:hypothetical protein T4D_5445 [Trichinella pseudospiralis]|uniref:Uncharacterized protein n=1 Tax=Trichinella pseudospiralis TaxID=6337 RepID=A0A0V1FXU8_TRIPS|nr:hypothetical protein T4D_5445 [Trichinella pseudospiralis]
MFLSNGNRFKYFGVSCHLELVIIKCVINFFHLAGACFVVVLGLADDGLPACIYPIWICNQCSFALLCSFRLVSLASLFGILIHCFVCSLLGLDRCSPSRAGLALCSLGIHFSAFLSVT